MLHDSVYLHASLSSNHRELPVTTTTCVHAHRCTCSGPYLFIFILKFQLTAKIYPSTFLLHFMSTVVSVHQYTSSVSFFFFGITCTVTFQFIYCGTYTEIFPEIDLTVYLHASLLSSHLSYLAHRCTCSSTYLFIVILSFQITTKISTINYLLIYCFTYNLP